VNTAPTLYSVLATISDPRSNEGRRFPLPVILCHVAVAMMAGCNSLQAVVDFVRDRGDHFARLLGYEPAKRSGKLHTPCKATLCYLLRRLDLNTCGLAIRTWMQQRFANDPLPVAIDGKTLRGTASDGESALRVLNVFCPARQQVVDQFAIAKGQGELKAALAWVSEIPAGPGLITADAGFCYREVAESLIDKGKDYVLAVKENQPTLLANIKSAFHTTPASRVLSA
jgi:hypothetical protein